MRILNLGCGGTPLYSNSGREVINVDLAHKNDIIMNFDITQTPYPLKEEQFDRIYFFHTLEHIPENQHPALFVEFRRLLKPTGLLCLSYPEFSKVAANWIEDKNGKRDFWKLTIYGRGLTEWDRHKALIDTPELAISAKTCGFEIVATGPEPKEDYNTITIMRPSEATLTYETLMEKEYS